jgi:branched-subunit amino acid aminotransferase/4-amino-4-deoxychorismate lyase
MHEFIFFNQQILPAKNAFLSVVSNAALYGKGIFTTVAVHDSIAFLWEKHWHRLSADAQKVGVSLEEFPEQKVEKSLRETIEKNNFKTGRARLTFYDETPGSVWQPDSERKTNLLIQTANFRAVPENFRLTVSPYRINSTSALAGVKSCNYLENILALERAKAEGFDEAVRLNEKDEVVSACQANVFWMRNGKIFTPSLESGCLKGTTREFILESFTVEERKANLAELYNADEIFLTSAGIGIVNCELENDQ